MNQVRAWNLGAYLGLSDSDAQILYFFGSLILTAVLVAVTVYYAWQNKRMVEEMRRQSVPYLYVTHQDDWLVVKNGGTRSAHEIRLEITRDALVPKQYRPFMRATIRREGDPPEPVVPDATPEQMMAMITGTTSVSSLPWVQNPIPSIVPGGEKNLARVTRHIGEKNQQTLGLIIRYRDGIGNPFEEALTLEYEI